MKFFKKYHNLYSYKKNNVILNIIQGQFSIYFIDYGILNYNEYKALKFYFRKKLKFFSKKLFFRITPKLKNTKKSIGVRMGKGKGGLNDFYFNIKKGQIFFEFGFKNKFKNLTKSEKNVLIKLFKRYVFLGSIKSRLKMKLKKND